MVRIWKSAQKHGWVVLNDLDMSALYAPDSPPQTILSVQICKQSLAQPYLNYSKLLALCMPCSLLILREEEETCVALLQPGKVLHRLFPEFRGPLREHGTQVDEELIQIVEDALKE